MTATEPPSGAPGAVPAPAARVRRPPDPAAERRQFLLAAVVLFGTIALLTGVVVLSTRSVKPTPATQAQIHADNVANPAVDQPYGGQAPSRPGDRGGWEQLALLGLIVVALAGGTTAVVLTSRRAKRRAGP